MSEHSAAATQLIARCFGVPMSLIDGRPWVAREDEQADAPDDDTRVTARIMSARVLPADVLTPRQRA